MGDQREGEGGYWEDIIIIKTIIMIINHLIKSNSQIQCNTTRTSNTMWKHKMSSDNPNDPEKKNNK